METTLKGYLKVSRTSMWGLTVVNRMNSLGIY